MANMIARAGTEATAKTPRRQNSNLPGKMSVMGVGGKIAIPTLLYIALAEMVSRLLRPSFRITDGYRSRRVLRTAGIGMAAAGFSLNLVAAFAMLKANKDGRLATGGLYRLFRDPMYVLQIFVTLPGLFLLFNSWLMLSGVIPAYIAYRFFVKEEHKYLEARFGEEYTDYLKKVLLKI